MTRRLMLALVVSLPLPFAGCDMDPTFQCLDDTQCGQGGRCEATGSCSFEDPGCASGRRYGAYAPAGIADVCVPLPTGQTSGAIDSTGGGDTATDDSDSNGPSGNASGHDDPSDDSSGGAGSSGPSSTGDEPGQETLGGPDQDCDPYLQDCPAGEKCNPWANDGGSLWNDFGCFPVDASPDEPNDSCVVEAGFASGYDSCDLGSTCWEVDPTTEIGTCVALCSGSAASPSCPDAATSCVQAMGVDLCLPGCDPFLQNCGTGEGCYPGDEGFVCAPDVSGRHGQPGDACEFVNACSAGNACVDAETHGSACGGFGCCSPFCDVFAAGSCAPGQTCVAWYDVPPPGFEDIGVCTSA